MKSPQSPVSRLGAALAAMMLLAPAPGVAQDYTQLGIPMVGTASGDYAGSAVAISGNGQVVVFGSDRSSEGNPSGGYARVHRWDGSAWQPMGNPLYGATGERSGSAVAVSADGMTIAVGAYRANSNLSGKTRVYAFDGSNLVQRGADINGENSYDNSGGLQGQAVALSADGNVLAVGALNNDASGQDAGHVRVFEWAGSGWVQRGEDMDGEAARDNFGQNIALSDDGLTLAAGAMLNDGAGASAGHVRVHRWDGAAWNQLGTDIDGEVAGELLGSAVALSGDGNMLAAGAFSSDAGGGINVGATRVYAFDGSGWVGRGSAILGLADFDKSGMAVALSDNGGTLAVGAHFASGTSSGSGTVRLFTWDGADYAAQGSILSGAAADDEFGTAVSLSADGLTLAAGSPLSDDADLNAGHVRVFQRSVAVVAEFAVNMGVAELSGLFSPLGGDRVAVVGDFNNWTPTANDFLPVDPQNSEIYRGPVTLAASGPAASEYIYKLAIVREGGAVEPEQGTNRMLNPSHPPDIVPFFGGVAFSDVFTTDIDVVVEVDLRPALYFLADSLRLPGAGAVAGTELFANGLFAAGSWLDWGTGLGSRGDLALLDDGSGNDAVSGDSIFTLTLQKSAGDVRRGVELKFGVDGLDNEAPDGSVHTLTVSEKTPLVRLVFGAMRQADGTHVHGYYTPYIDIDNETVPPTVAVVRPPSGGDGSGGSGGSGGTGGSGTGAYTVGLLVEEGALSTTLVFGTAVGATDGVDDGVDSLAPPTPPSGTFDARLRIVGTNDFMRDVRAPVMTSAEWTLVVQSSGSAIVISWDSALLPPDGSLRLFEEGGSVDQDMRTTQNVLLPGGATLTIRHALDVARTVNLRSGWNMVSLPVAPDDRTYGAVFPTSIGETLYRFSGSYVPPTGGIMEPGSAYWLRFPSAVDRDIRGQELETVTLSLDAGWNMVAPPGCSMPASHLIDGDLTLSGTLFGFLGVYALTNEMLPGGGYWIRASRAGQVTLDCGAVTKGGVVADPVLAGLSRLVLRDVVGTDQELFVGVGSAQGGGSAVGQGSAVVVPDGAYTLPPMPPGLPWRAAFPGDRYVFIADAPGAVAELTVQHHGTLTLTGFTGAYELLSATGDVLGGVTERTNGGPEGSVSAAISIPPEVERIRLVVGQVAGAAAAESALSFALHAAYPNPVQEQATVSYDVAGASTVEIGVYDLLGRRVMLLVPPAKHAAGQYRAVLRTDDLASGIYMLRLHATPGAGQGSTVHTQTRRVVIVR